ncbi:hypothetical protein ACE6H2_023594 [Prunus campanulata]
MNQQNQTPTLKSVHHIFTSTKRNLNCMHEVHVNSLINHNRGEQLRHRIQEEGLTIGFDVGRVEDLRGEVVVDKVPGGVVDGGADALLVASILLVGKAVVGRQRLCRFGFSEP